MLRFKNVNLKLISDFAKYQFVESVTRGGIFMIFKFYAEAYKFLKSYDANKTTSCVIYVDPNNLYRHSMMQLLLIQILDWPNPKDFSPDNYSNNSPKGCFLEVNLAYSDKVHDLHNYYPLAGEKIKVI